MRLAELSADLGGGVWMRPIEDADVPELFRVVDANREYLRVWLPWLDMTQSEEDLRVWATSEREKTAANRSVQFLLLEADTIAGVAGYHEIDWEQGQVELGYWLTEGHQGRGLMTRAAEELVRIAFEELRLNRVGIKTATGNVRSRAIPERLGFRHEGVLREGERLYDRYVDLDTYSLLASEWRARARPAALRARPRLRSER